VKAYRKRTLKRWYPIIFVDGVVINIRRKLKMARLSTSPGIDEDGHKEVLGFWLGGSEGKGSDIWKGILRELWERGLKEPSYL